MNSGVPNLKFIRLKTGNQMIIFFRKKFNSDLPSKSKCTENENFSLSKCFQNYVEKKIGCSLNLFTVSDSIERCKTMEKVNKTLLLLKWIQNVKYSQLEEETGCYRKCKYFSYEIEIKDRRTIDWETDWLSELYIYAASDIVEEREEYYTFDLINCMGTIGGYLGGKKIVNMNLSNFFSGLFLGWSLLSVATDGWKLVENFSRFLRK